MNIGTLHPPPHEGASYKIISYICSNSGAALRNFKLFKRIG